MTGKERCLASIEGHTLDRPPVYFFITNSALVEHLAGKTLTVENGERLLAKAYCVCTDTTRQFLEDLFIIYDEGELKTDQYGFVRRRSRFKEWVERRPWNDLEGMASLIKKQIENMLGWEPEQGNCHKKRYQCLEDLTAGQIMLMGRAYVGTAPGSYFRDGLDNWSYLVADYPDLAQAWVDARHQMNLKHIRAYADPKRCPIEHYGLLWR